MGHEHLRSNGRTGRSVDFGRPVIRRIPRQLRIILVILAGLILLFILAIGTLIILLLIKLIAGGRLPNVLQLSLDFIQRNLKLVLQIWTIIQSLGGNSG